MCCCSNFSIGLTRYSSNMALSTLMLTVGCTSKSWLVSEACWLLLEACNVFDTVGNIWHVPVAVMRPCAWMSLLQERTHKGSLYYAVKLCKTALHKAAEARLLSGRCLLVPNQKPFHSMQHSASCFFLLKWSVLDCLHLI